MVTLSVAVPDSFVAVITIAFDVFIEECSVTNPLEAS